MGDRIRHLLGCCGVTLIACAGPCAGAGAAHAAMHARAAGGPPAAAAGSGCAEQGRSTVLRLTPALKRRIERGFLHRHRGYRILRVGTSVLAPPHYVGLYWAKPAAGGTDAAAGVAYYCNGRWVAHPVHNAMVAFDAIGEFAIESQGSGTYTYVKKVTDPDPEDPDTITTTATVDFRWDDVYGTRTEPATLRLGAGGQNIAGELSHIRSSLTGTGTYQYSDSTDPTQAYTCTYTIGGVGDPTLQWDFTAHDAALGFDEDPPGPNVIAQGTPSGSNPNATCADDPVPVDPATGSDPSLSFDYPVLAPGRGGAGAVLWKPLAVPIGYDHPSHSFETDPSSGVTYETDQDLKLSGSAQFTLYGVTPG